eukprot:jgi/Mesen1/7470/ME000039S06684
MDKNESNLDACFFDLDDTLYPLSSGLAAACRVNITDYMVEKLGFAQDAVAAASLKLYMEYGTTMAGLRAKGYKFDFDDYHSFVHGRLPYHLLKPDPVLRNILQSMSQRKFVFTNGDVTHAAKCLQRLGLEDCFEKVIAFETVMEHPAIASYPHAPASTSGADVVGQVDQLSEAEVLSTSSWEGPAGALVCCKPQTEAFLRAAQIAGCDLSRTFFFDDSMRNIAAAKSVGLRTCLVGVDVKTPGADHAVASIHNIREAVPELWTIKTCPFFDGIPATDTSVAVEFVHA